VGVGLHCHQAMLIVDGTADMYTSSFHKISVWDVCAAHAIVRAVGGNLLTLQLTPLDYGRRNLRDGLFFHHPGLDAPLRQKVKAMYEFLSAHYRAERERKAIK
jgi:3'-phosphoadenosine 5'-phosphosulfate (PAPS) 3'-phosphatase